MQSRTRINRCSLAFHWPGDVRSFSVVPPDGLSAVAHASKKRKEKKKTTKDEGKKKREEGLQEKKNHPPYDLLSPLPRVLRCRKGGREGGDAATSMRTNVYCRRRSLFLEVGVGRKGMAEPIPFSKPSSLHHVGIATYVAQSLSSARRASLSPGQKRRLQEQQRFRLYTDTAHRLTARSSPRRSALAASRNARPEPSGFPIEPRKRQSGEQPANPLEVSSLSSSSSSSSFFFPLIQ